jgi:hypothetical protein
LFVVSCFCIHRLFVAVLCLRLKEFIGLTSAGQEKNPVGVAGACRIKACSLHNSKLSVSLDKSVEKAVEAEMARFSQITEILQRLGLGAHIPTFMSAASALGRNS